MTSVRRPLVAVISMVVLVIVQAVADPTGLLALVGWSGARLRFDLGVWPLAPYLVFVPVLLVMTWWAALRAGQRYWTLVPGLVLAVLLAQALACLAMTGDAAVAAYAAGFVVAKAVPAALIVAALTRWFGGRSPRVWFRRGSRASLWVPAVILGAFSPALAGLWWTGVAYAPGIPTPHIDRGPVSVITAMVLIAAATWLCLRWMKTRVRGVLGGWLAAVVAGGMVGVVQALVGLIVDGGFRGDIWPLMVGYITVADGMAFGACTGWIVGLAGRGIDRLGARRAARGTRLAGASLAAIAVVAALVVPVSGGSAAASDTRAIPSGFLRAQNGTISDGDGDQVLLRGVNVNQLVDFYQHDPTVPATRPLTEQDFADIAAHGFNVVRLNLSWSALEPQRGTFDPAYIGKITQAVDWASKHGIYTVLDMHQDGWWNGATTNGTHCRPGTDPMWGYDGAPEWATITDGAPRCQFTGRDISPAGDRAFQHFLFNTDGTQDALADTWGRLAGVFADEPMVAGFDLMNEPGFGETAPVTTSDLLGGYDERAIQAIRAAGARQIVFVEPSILWSGLGFDTGPTPGFTNDANIVFSPHLYAESITMDRDLGIPPIVGLERQFTLAQRVADEYHAPLWSGEYGYWGKQADVLSRLSRYAAQEDEDLLGSAYWVWKQACGDPQNGIAPTGNGLMVQDCATGGDAPPQSAVLDILSRAYPRSAPGILTSLKADGAVVELTGTSTGGGCGLDVWVPGAEKPKTDASGISDLKASAVAGGWRLTGCAEGKYALTTGG